MKGASVGALEAIYPGLRLGYACVNQTLGETGRSDRTCRLANATPARLEQLSRANLDGLCRALAWNAERGIRVFRMSSDLIPLASHPDAQWEWRETLADKLSEIGRYARDHGLRLSMHPGQYTVLNSPKPHVVTNAMQELRYHADLMDLMALAPSSKIVLHVGGVYGDKSRAKRQLCDAFAELPGNVQARLVLENDERGYGAEDVLELCQALKVPMIFDDLHHRAYAGEPPSQALLADVLATWDEQRDGRPKLHFSSQRSDARAGAHADGVDAGEFRRFVETLPTTGVDVMLEAKAKERALFELVTDLAPESPS